MTSNNIANKDISFSVLKGGDGCPNCAGGLIVDYRRGDTYCRRCGLVISDQLFDCGPEYRAFDQEQRERRARTGGPISYSKTSHGLTTEIDRRDTDIKKNAIPSERKAQLYRLRKWQTRSRISTSIDRNLSIALPQIDRLCSQLNLPYDTKEEISYIYRKFVNRRLGRGTCFEAITAAVVYYVSKKNQQPISIKRLAPLSNISEKQIGRAYRRLCRLMNLRRPVNSPIDYVPGLASKLNASGETEAKAIEILEKAITAGLASGKAPQGVAAAAIYLAAEGKYSQEQIADHAKCTTYTIRTMSQEMRYATTGQRTLADNLPEKNKTQTMMEAV